MGDKEKSSVRIKDTLSMAEAAECLASIHSGMANGRIELSGEGNTITLSPPSVVSMKIKASRKGDREKLEIEIEWKPKSAATISS